MPLLNDAIEMQPEIAGWRRQLHMQPELLFDVHKTAGFVTEKLKSFGCDEIVTGIGRTGVVGLIKGRQGDGQTVGLRADMDALPITEATGLPYASQIPGRMHACGHDGHTAMLLGAARQLCQTRNFAGSVAVIFQPAEEGGGGGHEMVKDGMIERFAISEVYGMHTEPGLPVGQFGIREGAFLASMDTFSILIKGKGGHAAMPHLTVDPIFIGAQIVTALQGIASRNADPVEAVVVSITQFNGGEIHNVISPTATLIGTVRTLNQAMRGMARENLFRTVTGIATALGGVAEIDYGYLNGYPVTVNTARETDIMARVAKDVSGAGSVNRDYPPTMGCEDFAFMLERCPGAMILIGNGDSAYVHNPEFDFADDAIPYGVSFWVRLAETTLAAKG